MDEYLNAYLCVMHVVHIEHIVHVKLYMYT